MNSPRRHRATRAAREPSDWASRAVVAAVIVSMWAGGRDLSIEQSRDNRTALRDMESTAANLAFAFDDEITHTPRQTSPATMDAVANSHAARRDRTMNILRLGRRQFSDPGRGRSSASAPSSHRPDGLLVGRYEVRRLPGPST